MVYSNLPKYKLGFYPTPVQKLQELERSLNSMKLLLKRDDLTGLAFGGNKTRKLEYLLGEAVKQSCDTVITGGSEQSNHCRQTAAAAAAAGLECHLALGGEEPESLNGNVLLDKILGANIHWAGESRKGEKIPIIAEELKSKGKKPYVVPYGGSNEIGAVGFVEAMHELSKQLDETKISHIVFASSSGGTHAGMLVGAKLFMPYVKVVGITIDKGEAGDGPFDELIIEIANLTSQRLNIDLKVDKDDIILENEYVGEGYGIVGDLERNAIKTLAVKEGILMDPVYTGRAMGAMLDLIEKEYFSKDDSVLFWHTGGTPAIFPYAKDIL